tara:strand:- start:1058 stop:1381 length:324 start_codon:yes stop_codon:yes gene_type:complete
VLKMGITMTCEACFTRFVAFNKEDTLPDEEGYVLCPKCKFNPAESDRMNAYAEAERQYLKTLEAVILGIAPWVGVKPPNNSQFTKEYNKKWKAFARVLRKIKEERGL